MNLIKSTGTFGFYTIISRILGYIKRYSIAIFLGTGFIADAFFVAFRIPNTFRRLFAEGTFNAAFVPSYTSEQRLGKIKSEKFANQIFNLLFLGLLILVIIIQLYAWICKVDCPRFCKRFEKIDLAVTLTRITFLFYCLCSLASFFSAILNSNNRFAAAAAAPIILNFILIIVLIFSKNIRDQLVYYLILWCINIGNFTINFFIYFC